MTARSIPVLLSFIVVACADPERGETSAASAITTAPGTTGTTAAPTTATGTTAAPTTGSGGDTDSGTSSTSTTAAATGTSTGASTDDATTVGIKLDLGPTPDLGGDTDGDACMRECEADHAGQEAGDWLLHIGNGGLHRVNVADATTQLLCPQIGSSHSLTFTRDNRLFSSTGSVLNLVDPCTCTSVEVGKFPNGYGGVNGIAPDEGNELFGFSSQAEALIRINTQTAEVTEVGPVGIPIGTHGAAWSEQDQILYLLTPMRLYTVDTGTGMATEVGMIDAEFSTVGVELHPASGLLYGCTADANLYQIDRQTAQTTVIGPLQNFNGCTNLGAPWTTTDICLPIPG